MKEHRESQLGRFPVDRHAARLVDGHLLKIRMHLESPDPERLCPLELLLRAIHAGENRPERDRTRHVLCRLRQKIVDAAHLMRARCGVAHDKARDPGLVLEFYQILRRRRVAGDIHAAVKRADGGRRFIRQLLREDMRVNVRYLHRLFLCLSGAVLPPRHISVFQCNIIPRNRTPYK